MVFFQFTDDLSLDIEYFFVNLATLINSACITSIYLEKTQYIRWGYYWQNQPKLLPEEILQLGKFSDYSVIVPDSVYITRNLYKPVERAVGVSGKIIDKFEDFPLEELIRSDQHFKLSISLNPQQRLPVSNQGTLVSILLSSDNYQVAKIIATWLDGKVSIKKRGMLAVRSELPYFLRPPVSTEQYNREGCFRRTTSINSVYREDPDLLTRHCLVCGQIGSGKTNTAKLLTRQVLESDSHPSILIIDFKEEYQDLASRYKLPYIHLAEPVEIKKLNINPFLPGDNVSLINHLELLSTIFSVSGFTASGPILPEYMKQVIYSFFIWFWNISPSIFSSLLYQKGEDLRKNRYLFYSPKGPIPSTLAQFWEVFKETQFDNLFSKSPGRNLSDIKATISARINGLKYSYINNFSYDENAKSFDSLLTQSLILSFKDIADSQVTLLLSMLFLLTSASARARENSASLQNLILIEEAHLIMRRSVQSAEVINASQVLSDQIERILAELRAKGVGLIIVDQSPNKLVRGVLANTATKIAHKLVLIEDLQDIYSALGLQESIGLQNLNVGTCYHKIDSQPIRTEQVKRWDA